VLSEVRTRQLGIRIVRIGLPGGIDARTAKQILSERDPEAFELNHLYTLADDGATCNGPACADREAVGWPLSNGQCGDGQTIGIVDSAVLAQHPAFAEARLTVQRFGETSRQASDPGHGSAIAGLLVGSAESPTPGLLPRAKLYAADPFFTLPSGANASETTALIEGIDWLIGRGAKVIGLSLSGPPNQVLAQAVEKAAERGVLLVAAAGNGGRNAGTAYPAGYPGVLSVTAVSTRDRVYRRANRGEYIDLAAPGVRVWTLDIDGDGKRRSGTSFAVPFVVALASQALAEKRVTLQQLRAGQGLPLIDLGAPGHDPVYGWGRPRYDGDCS
jgi:subtilisin family serine protease